ncbi:hypothetical protein ACIOD2_46585 [Amycolatopsis sp. NPDC088138]|uniref:hypothetical protein n=1 Tax=Amycolatopsis sp. NPDC088138 TaxID=3363938 RepID=UPI00382B9A46
MPPYTLAKAFEDVTVAVLESHEPLGYERRVRAARLLCTFVRAACAAGLPDDLDEWPPPTHPATWIVTAMRHADEPPTNQDIDPANNENTELPNADRLAEYDAALQASPTFDEFDPLIRRA